MPMTPEFRRLKQKNQYGSRASLIYTVNSKTAWLRDEILSQIIHRASVILSKHGCTYSHSCCPWLLGHYLGGLNTYSLVLSVTEKLAVPALCYTFCCLLGNSSSKVPDPADRDWVIPIFLCPSSPIGVSLLD